MQFALHDDGLVFLQRLDLLSGLQLTLPLMVTGACGLSDVLEKHISL